jgi:hypothetical protein
MMPVLDQKSRSVNHDHDLEHVYSSGSFTRFSVGKQRLELREWRLIEVAQASNSEHNKRSPKSARPYINTF